MDEFIISEVIETNNNHRLFSNETPVLIMLSGGSDSVALTYIMHELNIRGLIGKISALHVNHKLRGVNADKDAEFVDGLCKHLKIPLFMAEVDIASIAKESGENVEAVGRRERYALAHDALHSLCNHAGVTFEQGKIATAHTLNDRAENFYMRSVVGTGPFGLAGISHIAGNIIRPVLDFERYELQNLIKKVARPYFGVNGAIWCTDATNEETDRFRTYIRNVVMPLLEEKNPHYLKNLRRTMDNIAETNEYVNKEVENAINKCLAKIDDSSVVIKPQICEFDTYIIKQVIYRVLSNLLGIDSRVNGSTIDDVLSAINKDKKIVSGYIVNIQGNMMVSANKRGILIEPVASYRARRNRLK